MGELFGNYELLEKIGEGGMAEVYKARRSGVAGFQKILVVKKILPMFATNTAFIEMLVQEAKICSILQHPNVVPIFDLGEVDGSYYITMEYVPGIDLLRVLQRAARSATRVPTTVALQITAELAKALAYAHSAHDHDGRPLNLVHRDVSPANVMIGWRGEVKLMDFGVARADIEVEVKRGAASLVRHDGLKGKLSYMSPELVTGGAVDHRSDLFALGTLLYEMLTLKRLFMGKSELHTLSNIREARITRRMQRHDYIPDGVQAIIRRSLAREPGDRYQSALEFEEAIADYLFEERIRTNAATIARFMADLFPERPGGAAVPTRTGRRPSALDGADGEEGGEAGTLEEQGLEAGAARGGVEEDTLEDELVVAPPGDEDGLDTWLTERDPVDGLIEVVRAARAPVLALHVPAATDDASGRLALASFRVRSGPRAETLGPISAYNMAQLLRSRAVSGDEEVSIDGGPWTRVAASELRPLLPEVLAETGTPLTEGRLERPRLPRLFLRLCAAGANGMLAVARGWMRKELYYEDGVLVHVHSNLREELFARSVVADGVVPGDSVQRALEHARVNRIQLGEALVALGLLTDNALRHVLARQQERRFHELFSWPDGRFAWFGDVPVPDYARGEGLDVPSLIAGIVRSAFAPGELAGWLAPVRGRGLVLRTADVIDPAKLGLEAEERAALEALTAGASLEEAAAAVGEAPALRVAYLLLQADLAAVAPG